MPGINSVLDIGRRGLFSSQKVIETTGNNIANVHTPGYSRREVILEEAPSIDYSPGQLGTGVRATQIVRKFNNFIEEQYDTKLSDQERWNTLQENLQSVEAIFNNSEGSGLNQQALAEFWQEWQNVAQRPEDNSTRNSLLGNTQNLINTVQIADTDLLRLQNQMNDFISQDTERVNELMYQISDLNQKIIEHTTEGQNNPNQLYDERSTLLRELAEKIDINIIDNGGGDLIVTTRAGHTLIDGIEHFRMAFEEPQIFQDLVPDSTFSGKIEFQGTSENEYLIEVVNVLDQDGDGTQDAAELKFSLDGGKNWLQETKVFSDSESKLLLPYSDVTVSLQGDQPSNLSIGDQFNVVPKNALYWYKTSSSKINITPIVMANGEDNERRAVGGSLAGLFNFRDNSIGSYREKLNAFSKSLIWEVNRQHTQGAGLQKLSSTVGTYKVEATDQPLGSDTAGLEFKDRLQNGNLTLYLYDQDTGELAAGPQYLDMDPDQPERQSFNPEKHSLQDLAEAINNLQGVRANILNGHLELSASKGYNLAVGSDSTGILSALGINTFFSGQDASSLQITSTVNNNLNFINAGKINGQGEINQGDNSIAQEIADLQYKEVQFKTKQEGTTEQTLQDYYNGISAQIGSEKSAADYNHSFYKTLADDLKQRQESIAGVNLDEEMSNLIKFQQAYTAAAKLITTAEQMMNTVIQMKQ